MSKFWSSVVSGLKPYTPGEQPKVPGLIKLNTNEHCLQPSRHAMAVLNAMTPEALRRYPDPECTALRSAIARCEGLSVAQVFVGNMMIFQSTLIDCQPRRILSSLLTPTRQRVGRLRLKTLNAWSIAIQIGS